MAKETFWYHLMRTYYIVKETGKLFDGFAKHKRLSKNEYLPTNWGLDIARLTSEDIEHLQNNGIISIDINGGEYSLCLFLADELKICKQITY